MLNLTMSRGTAMRQINTAPNAARRRVRELARVPLRPLKTKQQQDEPAVNREIPPRWKVNPPA